MKEVVWSLQGYLSCQTFDYVATKWNIFSYHFLKVSEDFYFVSMKIFLLWLFGTMKKKNVRWKKKYFMFAEMLNDFHSDIILLQLVWIVCRDVELLTNILYSLQMLYIVIDCK